MNDVTLLSSIDEGSADHDGFTVIRISGEPYAAAMVGIVTANYRRVLGTPEVTQELLDSLEGEKVTLILTGENMLGSNLLVGREGKLYPSTHGVTAILPKGSRSRGYRVDPRRVLDIIPGYSIAKAKENVESVRSIFPTLTNLTQETLDALPRESSVCSLAVFGSNPLWGAPDCLWLIGEYWPEDDICETNVMLIRPEYAISESGSCFGRDLLRNRSVGQVVGFEPIEFGEALELTNIDFDRALERIQITAEERHAA